MKLDNSKVGKVIGLGGTFPTHHAERVTKWPAVWQEPAEAVIMDDEPIEIPPEASNIVPGPEPTIVMGDSLYRGTEEEAIDAIGGFTVSNDVTSKGEWPAYCYENEDIIDGFAYKMLPTFRPVLSNVININLEEISDAEICATIDGDKVISGTMSEASFSIPEMLVHVSKIVKLEKNDLVAIGDPGDCSKYLTDDNSVTCSVEGIGELTNPVTMLK